MGKFHGSKGVFKIDDAGGTLRDISIYIDDMQLSRKFDTPETTGEGQGNAPVREYIPGLQDADIAIKGSYDNAATTGSATVLAGIANAGGQLTAGGSLSFEVHPSGTASGTPKRTGECFMTQYDESAPVNGRVSFSAGFKVSGAIANGTN